MIFTEEHVAEDWPYVWRWRNRQNPWAPEGVTMPHPFACRVGQRFRVLVRGAMNSALIEFQDGFKTVTSRNAIRRAA